MERNDLINNIENAENFLSATASTLSPHETASWLDITTRAVVLDGDKTANNMAVHLISRETTRINAFIKTAKTALENLEKLQATLLNGYSPRKEVYVDDFISEKEESQCVG